jgi:hypothetical protein
VPLIVISLICIIATSWILFIVLMMRTTQRIEDIEELQNE